MAAASGRFFPGKEGKGKADEVSKGGRYASGSEARTSRRQQPSPTRLGTLVSQIHFYFFNQQENRLGEGDLDLEFREGEGKGDGEEAALTS